MVRNRSGRPSSAVIILLAALAVLPSIRWCRYAWADVTIDCLVGASAACAASAAVCDEAAACDVTCEGPAERTATQPPAGAPEDATDPGGRAWCPGGPLGGCGIEARIDPWTPPSLAPLPGATLVLTATVSARWAPPPRARPPTPVAVASPPIRAPPGPA